MEAFYLIEKVGLPIASGLVMGLFYISYYETNDDWV
jgi:hypothetical protein